MTARIFRNEIAWLSPRRLWSELALPFWCAHLLVLFRTQILNITIPVSAKHLPISSRPNPMFFFFGQQMICAALLILVHESGWLELRLDVRMFFFFGHEIEVWPVPLVFPHCLLSGGNPGTQEVWHHSHYALQGTSEGHGTLVEACTRNDRKMVQNRRCREKWFWCFVLYCIMMFSSVAVGLHGGLQRRKEIVPKVGLMESSTHGDMGKNDVGW